MEKKKYSVVAKTSVILLELILIRDVLEAVLRQLFRLPFDIRLRLGIHHTCTNCTDDFGSPHIFKTASSPPSVR